MLIYFLFWTTTTKIFILNYLSILKVLCSLNCVLPKSILLRLFLPYLCCLLLTLLSFCRFMFLRFCEFADSAFFMFWYLSWLLLHFLMDFPPFYFTFFSLNFPFSMIFIFSFALFSQCPLLLSSEELRTLCFLLFQFYFVYVDHYSLFISM